MCVANMFKYIETVTFALLISISIVFFKSIESSTLIVFDKKFLNIYSRGFNIWKILFSVFHIHSSTYFIGITSYDLIYFSFAPIYWKLMVLGMFTQTFKYSQFSLIILLPLIHIGVYCLFVRYDVSHFFYLLMLLVIIIGWNCSFDYFTLFYESLLFWTFRDAFLSCLI